MANKTMNYGEYAFLGGVLLALITGVAAGFIPPTLMPVLTAFLFLCGIIVGLLNVTDKEVTPFLVATVALLLAASAFGEAVSGTFNLGGNAVSMVPTLIVGFVTAFKAFIAPAAFIVAIKAVYKMAQPD